MAAAFNFRCIQASWDNMCDIINGGGHECYCVWAGLTSSWSTICCLRSSASWLCWLISSSCQKREKQRREGWNCEACTSPCTFLKACERYFSPCHQAADTGHWSAPHTGFSLHQTEAQEAEPKCQLQELLHSSWILYCCAAHSQVQPHLKMNTSQILYVSPIEDNIMPNMPYYKSQVSQEYEVFIPHSQVFYFQVY